MFHPIRNKKEERPKPARVINPYIKYGYWAADPTKPLRLLNKPVGGGGASRDKIATVKEKPLPKPVIKREKPVFTKKELKGYPMLNLFLNHTSMPLERLLKGEGRVVVVRRATCTVISPITGEAMDIGTVLHCRGAPA